MDWKKAGIAVLVLDILVINMATAYTVTRILRIAKGGSETGIGYQVQIPDTADRCGPECQAQIRSEMAMEIERMQNTINEATRSAMAEPTEVPVPTATRQTYSRTPVPTKTRTVQYVTIPGTGNTQSMVWQDVAGTEIYFDKADYPGLVEVYFEANMNLKNGNGKAYIRLYDVTHGIGVDGSGVETSAQAASLITSGKLNFWAGKNLVRVQAKTLTADTTVYNYGRLKIISEN